MMSVVLRFSGSYNLAALAVKTYTWSWCSHVETVMEDPQGNKVLFGALPGTGVNYRPINSTEGDRVEEYKVILTPFIRHLYLEKLLSQKGKPYDYISLAGMVIHRDWETDDSSWFCSELVAWAFNQAGRPLVRTEHKNRITPKDLLLSPLLERIT
jgi:hypothetical protein